MEKLVEKIYGLELHKAKYTLDNMKVILELLGNPQLSYKTIHVTGTNGKGSTSNFISSVLARSHKVGLFTSPHYFKYNERFKINGEDISDEVLEELFFEIESVLKKNNLSATFFEFTTALGFLYFKKEKVDFAVIEVGLGGRLDATNMISPVGCVITNISLDHTNILGKTESQIAKEKAEIIKAPLFTADKDNLDVFNSKGFPVKTISDFKVIHSSIDFQEFDYKGNNYKLKMLGEHQIVNACIVIDLCEFLGLSYNDIFEGLFRCEVRGRLSVLNKDPLVILDGAHNVSGFLSLINFLEKVPQKKTLVLGLSKDKDVESIAKIINERFEKVIITEFGRKPMEAKVISRYVDGEVIYNLEDVLKKAAESKNALIVAGSLYLIPELEKKFKNYFKSN